MLKYTFFNTKDNKYYQGDFIDMVVYYYPLGGGEHRY